MSSPAEQDSIMSSSSPRRDTSALSGRHDDQDYVDEGEDMEDDEEDDARKPPSYMAADPQHRLPVPSLSPQQRVLKGTSITDDDRDLAKEADPNDGRCMVHNCATPATGIELAHVVQRALAWSIVRLRRSF